MRVSGFCHTYIFVSIESVITLLILNWKNVVSTTLWLLKRDLFKTCYIKSERKNLWSWFNLFFLLRYCLNNFMFYNGWKSFTNYGRIHDIFFVINWSWGVWEALYRLDRKLGGLPSSVVGGKALAFLLLLNSWWRQNETLKAVCTKRFSYIFKLYQTSNVWLWKILNFWFFDYWIEQLNCIEVESVYWWFWILSSDRFWL